MKRETLLSIILTFTFLPLTLGAQVPEPGDYFGHQVGADYTLIGWQKIVDYFQLLDQGSERLSLETLGQTTNDNPMVMAVISSSENLSRLDEIRAASRRIADPRGLSEDDAKNIARDTPIVVLITCSMHATEVGAAQASVELAYGLVTREDEETRRIRDRVVFLLVPSFNPDGLILVKEWYDTYLKTEFEGGSLPWLYHHYVGHDNNRDAFMLTQKESRMVNRVLFKDWFPAVYLDMHQMGNSASRIFVPPFIDPLNPNTDPLIVWEIALFGNKMALDLEATGKSGVGSSHFFTAWWEGSFLMNVWWHNTVGLLTELASARVASPLFQKKSDLHGGGRGLPVYDRLVNFPNPWPGGWWRLRDIVDYDLIAARAVLEAASRYSEDFIYNRYLMGRRALRLGREEPPFVFIIPSNQDDMATARRMVNILMEGGVEVQQARTDFTVNHIPYPAGSYLVYMEQPFRAYAKDLLEPQRYPEIKENGDTPIVPYDVSGWTLPYQMGVQVVQIKAPFRAEAVRISEPIQQTAELPAPPRYGYLLRHRENNSFILTNELLKDDLSLYWVTESQSVRGLKINPGDVVIPARQKGVRQRLEGLAREVDATILPLNEKPQGRLYRLHQPRIAVYQPWLANMNEGWSRFVLEQYHFPYLNIHNEEIRIGNLRERYDVIYIPDIWAEGIVKGREEGTAPPLFTNGIGAEGVANLKKFVEAGGTLLCLDSSSELVIGEMGLPVRNVLSKIERKDFFCPGSILRMKYDPGQPLDYGMEKEGIAFFANSPAFTVIPNFKTEARVLATYPEKNILKSGFLLGEENIAQRAAMVEVPLGQGRVVLIGFDAVNRAQAHATFKLFFNALLYSAAEEITL